jgi:23S rRNA (uridine2552-2'-O)-methyltransferase
MGKYTPRDHYFRKAKREGFRARSAFKIEEIAHRFSLVRAGGRVLDLGAAPGGFLQVISEAVGPGGAVLGVDLEAIRPLAKANVSTATLDLLEDGAAARIAVLLPGPLDAVISDMAPKTTGVRTTDEARSVRLVRRALDIARERLRPGGHFMAKLFMGGEFEPLREELRALFADVKVVRPEATRGGSIEVYLVGLRRRPYTSQPASAARNSS